MNITFTCTSIQEKIRDAGAEPVIKVITAGLTEDEEQD